MGTQWLISPCIVRFGEKRWNLEYTKSPDLRPSLAYLLTFNFRGVTLSSTKSRFVEVNFGDKESHLPIQKHTRFIKRRRIFALCCHFGGGFVSSDGETLKLFWPLFWITPPKYLYTKISPKSLKRLGTVLKKPKRISPTDQRAFFWVDAVVLLSCSVGYGLGFRSKVIKDPQKKTIVWFIS